MIHCITFILSKVWYLARMYPITTRITAKIISVIEMFIWRSHAYELVFNNIRSRPKHTNKNWRFLFFIYFITTKSIKFINKPMLWFWFFPCCCFGFVSKAATTKNCQFIEYRRSQFAWALHMLPKDKRELDSIRIESKRFVHRKFP
jgi:hypothetical protein